MVLPVGDIDVAVLVDGDAPGLVELAWLFARPAAFAKELAFRAEDLQTIVAAVHDNQVTILFDRHTRRAHEFAIAASRRAEFPEEFTAAVEHRDCVGPFIRTVDEVALVIDGDAERPDRLAVLFAILE